VVADLKELPVHHSTLSLFTNAQGGIIDDTVINKESEDSFYVVSNAGCAEKDLKHIREQLELFRKKGGDANVEVLDLSLVALQGPKAAAVIEELSGSNLKSFPFMSSMKAILGGIPVYLSRCGYTGEDGFEVLLIDSDFSCAFTCR
jgi:aminomethyltransferase